MFFPFTFPFPPRLTGKQIPRISTTLQIYSLFFILTNTSLVRASHLFSSDFPNGLLRVFSLLQHPVHYHQAISKQQSDQITSALKTFNGSQGLQDKMQNLLSSGSCLFVGGWWGRCLPCLPQNHWEYEIKMYRKALSELSSIIYWFLAFMRSQSL